MNKLLKSYISLNKGVFIEKVDQKEGYIRIKSNFPSKLYDQLIVTDSSLGAEKIMFLAQNNPGYVLTLTQSSRRLKYLDDLLGEGLEILNEENWLVLNDFGVKQDSEEIEKRVSKNVDVVNYANFDKFADLLDRYFVDKGLVEELKYLYAEKILEKHDSRYFSIYTLREGDGFGGDISAALGFLYSTKLKFGLVNFAMTMAEGQQEFEILIDKIILESQKLGLKKLLVISTQSLEKIDYLLKRGFQVEASFVNLERKT